MPSTPLSPLLTTPHEAAVPLRLILAAGARQHLPTCVVCSLPCSIKSGEVFTLSLNPVLRVTLEPFNDVAESVPCCTDLRAPIWTRRKWKSSVLSSSRPDNRFFRALVQSKSQIPKRLCDGRRRTKGAVCSLGMQLGWQSWLGSPRNLQRPIFIDC